MMTSCDASTHVCDRSGNKLTPRQSRLAIGLPDRSLEVLKDAEAALQVLDQLPVNAKPEAPNAKRVPGRNRKPTKSPAKPLTAKQVEILRLHGECKGNMSEVARRMGVTHPTATQHYTEAHKKLGITASERARTTRLGADHLGQGVKVYD